MEGFFVACHKKSNRKVAFNFVPDSYRDSVRFVVKDKVM